MSEGWQSPDGNYQLTVEASFVDEKTLTDVLRRYDKDAQGAIGDKPLFTVKSTKAVTIDGTPAVQRREYLTGTAETANVAYVLEQGALYSIVLTALENSAIGGLDAQLSHILSTIHIAHSSSSTAFTPAHFGATVGLPTGWKQAESSDEHLKRWQSADGSFEFSILVQPIEPTTTGTYLQQLDAKNATGYEGKPSVEVLETKPIILTGIPGYLRSEYLLAADLHAMRTYVFFDDKIYTFTTLQLSGASDGDRRPSYALGTIHSDIMATAHMKK